MAKQLEQQRYVFKIHSERLRKSKWNLELSLSEARKNDEIISLAGSQMLRWIDELNGLEDSDSKAREIKSNIRYFKKQGNTSENKRRIRKLYAELDRVQFKPDYMCLTIDKPKDYIRACKGYYINGIKYVRLLGTAGGIKNSTIVFVSERLAPELRRRVDNGRNPKSEFIPAKLEAYKALTCSASIPVSFPKGVLVVSDCFTKFKDDVIYMTDENEGEPMMELRKNTDIEINASDGYGLMLPSLADRWSEDLNLDYRMSGCNIRCSYTKGMVYTFDFIEFAERVAGTYIVKDVWGKEVDVRNVELILTEGMLKLWDSYDSCEAYFEQCKLNHYSFGVTKTCPKVLENERCTNYQFIQGYSLTNSEIDELITPTVNDIKDAIGGDWRKTVLFLKGDGLNENNISKQEDDFIKAIMIDQRVINDPYIQSKVFRLIKNRINEAKVGVLKVHGNYSIISGDPYGLCQHIFELPVTGLLGRGEIYNKYWADTGAEYLACYRAPMSCIENVRKVKPVRRDDTYHWYQYMTACTIFNSWDTAMIAMNGLDFDGDLCMLTDNRVLVDKLEVLPALMCAQKKGKKIIVSDDDFVKANIESFGNDIGKTTNYITSMYEVRSNFEKNSKEYETLSYRIKSGQLFQQNVINFQ